MKCSPGFPDAGIGRDDKTPPLAGDGILYSELVGHLHFCNIYGRKEKLPVWMDWQLRMQPKFWFFGPELVILLQFSH